MSRETTQILITPSRWISITCQPPPWDLAFIYIDPGSYFPAYRTYDSAQLWQEESQSGTETAVSGPRWSPYASGTNQGLPWPRLRALAWSWQRLLRGKYRQKDQKQLKNQEADRAGRSTWSASRLMCSLLSWVQPSTCFSCLLRSSLRTELVPQEAAGDGTQRWPAESAPVPSIAVRSRGLSICFSCLWASEHQLIQYQCLSPSHQEKVLNRPHSEGAGTGTQRRGQLGLEQPPKR